MKFKPPMCFSLDNAQQVVAKLDAILTGEPEAQEQLTTSLESNMEQVAEGEGVLLVQSSPFLPVPGQVGADPPTNPGREHQGVRGKGAGPAQRPLWNEHSFCA